MLHIHHHQGHRHRHRRRQCQLLRQSQYGHRQQSQHSLPRYKRVRPAQAFNGSVGITVPAAAEWEPQPVRAGTAQEVIYALQPLPCIADYVNGGKCNFAAVNSVDNDELSVGSTEAASRTSAIIVSYVLGAILGVLMAGGVLLGAS